MCITSKTYPFLFTLPCSLYFYTLALLSHCWDNLLPGPWLMSEKYKTFLNSFFAGFRSLPTQTPVPRSQEYISLLTLPVKTSFTIFLKHINFKWYNLVSSKLIVSPTFYPDSRECEIPRPLQGTGDYFQSFYLPFTPLSPLILVL